MADKMPCTVNLSVSPHDVESFRKNGFLVHPRCMFQPSDASVQAAYERLEAVLNGEYDSGHPPVKVCAVPESMKRRSDNRFSFAHIPQRQKTQKKAFSTLHLINIWHSDAFFRSLVTSPEVGRCVTALMGWEAYGCRLGQDQVWIKPPGSGPLSFHRDTTYFDIVPKEVCTLWISFGALQGTEAGPLEYCHGSHLWGDGRRGSANQFFDPDYKALLNSAAEVEDTEHEGNTQSVFPLEITTVQGDAGCCAFHNGKTWHGSSANVSSHYRAGIGIHYIRGDAKLDTSVELGKLWVPYAIDEHGNLPDEFFPFVTKPS